jgi:predicted nucleic acid-binding protein
VIFDSDILIWVARRHPKAVRLVEEAETRRLSIITVMELLRGARDRKQLRNAKSFLREFNFEVLPLTENIGHRAAVYVEEYCLQVDLSVADALIAATAVENDLPLASGNVKHFSVIEGLDLRPFRAG